MNKRVGLSEEDGLTYTGVYGNPLLGAATPG